MKNSVTYEQAKADGLKALETSDYPCKNKVQINIVSGCFGPPEKNKSVWGFTLIPPCPQECVGCDDCVYRD